MIRHFFIALLILPVMAFSQQKKTIIISHDENNKSLFQKMFKHLVSPFQFVDRIFHKERNFVNRLHDRISINIDTHSGFTYRMPVIINDEHRIILNNKNVIILPQRKFIMDRDNSGVIIKRNGQTIFIKRDRRS